MLSPYSFNGVLLNDGFFSSDLRGTFDTDKSLTLNDIMGDGQAFGRSKASERKLVLNMVAGAYSLSKITALNAMAVGNALKPLIIDTDDYGQLMGYAEVTGFAWSDDSPLIISCQLTMPDPHWYTLQADTLSLEPSINSGVVFSLETILILSAGDSAQAGRTELDAGSSADFDRTILRGPGSDV